MRKLAQWCAFGGTVFVVLTSVPGCGSNNPNVDKPATPGVKAEGNPDYQKMQQQKPPTPVPSASGRSR